MMKRIRGKGVCSSERFLDDLGEEGKMKIIMVKDG